MSTVENLMTQFGKDTFVEHDATGKPTLARRTNKRILIVLDREIIGPFINRSTDPSDTIRYRFPDSNGREVIRVPSRKFKSKEKLRGLEVCRAFGLVDPGYEYNSVDSKDMLNNPNSVLFGDTETGGDAAGLPSKFIYGEGLSIEEVVNAVQPLTHNALSEEGTMWNRKEGAFRTSLFETISVLPGNHIIQTITIDSPTPESMVHLFICLTATRYGAQTSVTGSNMKNRVIAIVATTDEPPVTAYTIVDKIDPKYVSYDNIVKIVEEMLRGSQGKTIIGTDADQLVTDVQRAMDLPAIYQNLKEQADDFYKYVYESGKKKRKDKKGGRTAKGENAGEDIDSGNTNS